MEYLFLLGRNFELSEREIFSKLKSWGIEVLDSFRIKNGLLVDTDKLLKKNIIDEFGGVISIGKILFKGKREDVLKELENKNLIFKNKNNFSYIVYDFSESFYDDVCDLLRKKFRAEKFKATQKKISGTMESQGGENVSIVGSKLIDEQFFVFEKEGELIFGKFVEFYNYEALELRDMKKPVRRESLSISPRLAKMMINVSGVKDGGKILDPFCGVGVILQEGLLMNKNVIGIDMDRDAINGAKKNLEWFGFSKNKYRLINGDSSGIRIESCDVLVAEPDFGEILKKSISKEKALNMIGKYERLMVKVLNNLKSGIKKKIVFTAPFILCNNKKRIGCDFEKVTEKTGLRVVEGFPLEEFRKKQIVGRQIVVMKN